MPDHIRNNAYRILGLDNRAGPKDIVKRYREITNRLKIDDRPRYALDLNLPGSVRTENSVNVALKKLQNLKSSLIECFFWFSISDTIDKKAFEHMRHGDIVSYYRAARIWKKHSGIENSTGLSYKRNLAILYCLIMFGKEDDAILRKSVVAWKEVVDADRFWVSFGKKYAMDSGLKMHENAIDDLRRNISANISDVYHDLYTHHDNAKYVKAFQDVFGTLGQKTEKRLLGPIHQSVYDTIDWLEKIEDGDDINLDEMDDVNAKCDNCKKVSGRHPKSHFRYKDSSILCQKCHNTVGGMWQKNINSRETVEGSAKKLRQIEKATERLEFNLKQLRDLGLYDTDKTRMMRDHIAEAIRVASVEIHNQAYMHEESLKLLDVAKMISASEHARKRVERDSKIAADNITWSKKNEFVLEIGFIHKKKVVVGENFMEYEESKIYYDDVNSIAYYESESNYIFEITSYRKRIFVKFNNESHWIELIKQVWPLVKPHLTTNLVKQIFEKGQRIRIGDIRFDKAGYHRSRVLRRGKPPGFSSGGIYHLRHRRFRVHKKIESVLWSETIHTPDRVAGESILYKSKNNRPKRFASVSLWVPNAAVIPELVKACSNEFCLRRKVGRASK